jgi:NAD(P)-dependent dehydrogenase (short-subunit alcohol dehydrogenase family)
MAKQDRIKGRPALVTGAGAGLGRAIALALAGRGAQLVVTDINTDALARLEADLAAFGRPVMARVVDVADREAMRALADEVHAEVGPLGVLVNNAGVALHGGIANTTLEDWDWIMGINVMGVIHGCCLFVPAMKEAGRGGHVINLASLAGLIATEQLGAYSTTKFAVVGLSEALRDECAPYHIGVTAICPGFIQTDIAKNMRMGGRPEDDRRLFQRILNQGGGKPEDVAQAVLHAIDHNKPLVPVTAHAWLTWGLKRLSPDLATRPLRAVLRRLS